MQVKTITVESNDPERPVVHLQIRGTAVQGLRAQPSTLFFGRIEPGRSGRAPLKSSPAAAPSNQKSGRPIRGWWCRRWSSSPARMAPGTGLNWTRRLLPPGTVNGQVIVKTDVEDGREVAIPVAAYLVAPPAQP